MAGKSGETPDKMEQALDPDVSDVIEIDGVNGFDEVLQFHRPKTITITLLTAGFAAKNPKPASIARFIDGFLDLMLEDTADAVTERMMDSGDSFDVADLMELWGRVVEEASGNPTQQPSVSAGSRQTGGQKSTARASVRASASKRSR